MATTAADAVPGGSPAPPQPPQGPPATTNTANDAAAAANNNNNNTASNNNITTANNNTNNNQATDASSPVMSQPSRFAPQIALGDQVAPIRGGRGVASGARGFGDRGGRGGARGGRGRGDADATILLAAQAAMESSPSLPIVMSNVPAVVTRVNAAPAPVAPPQPNVGVTSGLQQGQRTFAAAAASALPPLTPFPIKDIPEDQLALVGFNHNCTLPLLPKKDAHLYEIGRDAGGRLIPFVCYGSKNFDDVHGVKTEEFGFKRKAIEHSARTVIVRTAVATSLPLYFIFDIQPTVPAVMWESRVQMITMKSEEFVIDGLAAPAPIAEDAASEQAQHLLQGTVAQLQAHAHHVIIRNVVAGQNDVNRIVEAVGYPHGDWQKHICGAPLHLVQEWRHAPRRATVKLAFDTHSSLGKRFNECGEFANEYASHIAGCYLSGFTFRIILKQTFTMDYKRFFASSQAVTNVYTDLRVAMTPPRVGEEATPHELDVAAQTVAPDEEPLFAGLVASIRPPPDLWTTIAAKLNLRLLHFNSFGCVFGCARAKVGGLVGKTLSGWARLSRTRLG